MTAYTSQRAGNWSVLSGTASSPWHDGGAQTALNSKPGAGDSAVINHNNVHVDENTTLGGDTAATWLSGTGTLEVDPGQTFLLKGRGISNNLSIVNRGVFQFYGATNGYWLQVRKFTSVSGSTIETTGGTNYGFFFGGAHNVTEIDIQDTIITGIGSGTFFNACGSPFVFKRNTITNCTKWIHTGSTATDALDVDGNVWVGAPRDTISELRLVGMVAPTGGTARNVINNRFTHNNEFFGDLTGLVWENNYYKAASAGPIVIEFGQPGTTTTNGIITRGKNNVVVGSAWSTGLVYNFCTGPFYRNLFHMLGAQGHFDHHGDQAGTIDLYENIHETGGNSDNGSCILIANDALKPAVTINVRNSIQTLSPGGTNAQPFVVHAGVPNNISLYVDHNDLAAGLVLGSYSAAGTYCNGADMLKSCQSNVLTPHSSNPKFLIEQGPQNRSARIGANVDDFDGGTLSAADATSFTDATAAWLTQYTDVAGFYIRMTSGAANGLATLITGSVSTTQASVSAWSGGITPANGDTYRILHPQLYDPANVGHNCVLNGKSTGTIRRRTGSDTTSVSNYDGHVVASGTPGSGDLNATDPSYGDVTRCLATYDTAASGLNNAAGTAWADTGSTYNVGDVVSRASSTVYNNATINYRCILAHAPTGVANDAPGTGSAWRTYWEWVTEYRIWLDPTITDAIVTWIQNGRAVSNASLVGAGHDGATIGAIPTAPTITSNGGGSTAAVSVQEGNTAVTTVTATGDATIAYSISGGADQALFGIDGSTGVLTFDDAPDYENPADANTDNDYVVAVTATNSAGSDSQTITVTVTNNAADDATGGRHHQLGLSIGVGL